MYVLSSCVASGIPGQHLCSVRVTRYSQKLTLKIAKTFFVFEPVAFTRDPPGRDKTPTQSRKTLVAVDSRLHSPIPLTRTLYEPYV